ncbi:MAG TPA: RsmB/NOP family class I SAM-dependent RNA methyltransferase, partial [Rhizobiales bacterium]|nr:RsmB/NOP family class I SAM-dependent RNA methyltransferase [Hyphomicrobiales bacterium]
RAYGEDNAHAIAAQHLEEAPVDITPRKDAQDWAKRLGGKSIPGGSVRLHRAGRIPELPGFREGAWWVQDAAAAVPVHLLGDINGQHIADLCAAPGGKTAQLIAYGAKVTAVDQSQSRMQRLRENLARLHMKAELVVENALNWNPQRRFDAILLDAPCSSTGTIRRHPDVQRLKTAQSVQALTPLQDQLLNSAARLLKPGGKMVYCVCSLQSEEGEERIESFLAANPEFHRLPIDRRFMHINKDADTKTADMRLLPSWLGDLGGNDGFFASLLQKSP